MLDLKELSRKLDLALESETAESLTNWLMKKRGGILDTYIGKGSYLPLLFEDNLKVNDDFVEVTEPAHLSLKENQEKPITEGNTQYSMAA